MPEIADALSDVGITSPFPIQEMTLSVALMGTDLIGQARTGTGKTLAFAIPVVQRTVAPHDPDYSELAAPGKPQALILTPTRELTIQVAKDIDTASAKRGTRNVVIYGGVPYEPQLEALESGVDIVTGTPGRVLDLVNRRALDLSHVKSMVLDEADEMLDLGFLPDVETIIAATPEHRQTMLFSATMPKAVVGLARRYAKRPTFVHAEPEGEQATVPATRQMFFQVHPLNRFQVLCRILDAPDRDRVAVFRRTKRGVDRTIKGLVDEGYRAGALHGDMPQVAREKVMRSFRKGKLDVLVCTDVASRGLDIAGLSHVINYDTPEDDRAYVHRIGRTGRAGAAGVAVTFVAWNELDTADLIRRRLELTDEPVHEVYSTSPLLSELFDLPTVEEAAAARAAAAPAKADKPAKAGKPEAPAEEEPARRRSRSAARRRRRRRIPAGERPSAATG